MNLVKRATTLIGVVAISASTLLASDAMAQQISTTLTVENSTPACADETPTSLSLNFGGNTSGGSFGTLTANTTNFNQKEIAGSVFMSLYVNECLGQGWNVTAAVTDFHSGPNAVDATGRISIYAQQGSVVNIPGIPPIVADYTRPVRPTGTATSPYSPSRQVPGTTGLPTPSGTTFGRMAIDGGDNLAIFPGTVSTGTVESTGEMVQAMKLRTANIPITTAPGTYSADFTLTFTSTGP
jgi:hypothetical protein